DPQGTLIGRRVAKVAFAIYASRRYLARHKVGRLADHRWIGPDDSLAGTSVAQWMRAELAHSEIALRADSFLALCHAAQAGLGVAGPALLSGRPGNRPGPRARALFGDGDGAVDPDARGPAPPPPHPRFQGICGWRPPPPAAVAGRRAGAAARPQGIGLPAPVHCCRLNRRKHRSQHIPAHPTWSTDAARLPPGTRPARTKDASHGSPVRSPVP